MTITRFLPNSNVTRAMALDQARQANGNQLPGVSVLNTDTVTRLGVMVTAYTGRMTAVSNARAAQTTHTPVKDAAVEDARRFARHFIMVFNLGVARGKYLASHRSYFDLPVDSDATPEMEKEAGVLWWCNKVVSGDAARVLAGGAAMANPDATEVGVAGTAAQTAINAQAALHLAVNTAQEALDALNADADALIKRIWNEVETYYSEEPAPSMRDKARQWGVVYISKGPAAILTGLVLLPGGTPAQGAVVTALPGGATAIANAEGRYSLSTSVLGNMTLQAVLAPHTDASATTTIPDHEDEVTIQVGDITLG